MAGRFRSILAACGHRAVLEVRPGLVSRPVAAKSTVAAGFVACLAVVSGNAVSDAATAGRFQIDSTTDAPDASPGDGHCRAAGGKCTLRAAIMEANADPGSTIVVPAGRYALTIPPRLGPAFTDYTLSDAASGNLKIMAPTTITGAGAGRTIVDGRHLDRVFTVLRPATISGLTVTGGRSAPTASPYNYYGGGGVLNASSLTMRHVRVTGNTATFGGGIFNIPFSSLTLSDSLVDGNQAGEAGGIRFDWQGLVERSTITGNRVVDPHDPTRPGELAGLGGGIDVRGPGITVVGSKVTGNYADHGGGGINITLAYLPGPVAPGFVGPGQVRLKDSVITGNTRQGGHSDCRAVHARFVSLGGNIDSDGSCR
jgi:CSLREA domain-containing protein